MSLVQKYIDKIISYEIVNQPKCIEIEKMIELLQEFEIALRNECEEDLAREKDLAERNYKILRGGK